MMGLDEAQYKEQFRPVAASQVKGALLLHELAGKQGIQVTPEDLENRVRKIAEESGQDFDRISRYYLQNEESKQNLEEQVREEKVLEVIASKAVITEKQRVAA
jgi:trigger factor